MKTILDIPYSNADCCLRKLDIYLPDSDHFPVFLYFHGGGICEGDKSTDCAFINDLVNSGVAVVTANYRLYPDAVFPEFLRDAAAAVAWTKKHIAEFGRCEKLIIGGSSAGGYITQMIFFDKKYLSVHGLDPDEIDGYFFDAGQPTSHFNVLKERGLDPRRIIVDETAPLYFIEAGRNYPPMKIIVSDHDMENRLEQTHLLVSTIAHFGHNMENVDFEVVQNSSHCQYLGKFDAEGKSVFAQMILSFIQGLR